MPIAQPEVTDTQSHQERDASLNIKAHVAHEVNERYIWASDFAGTGTYSAGTDPPGFDIGNGKNAHVTFPAPSYWWNGHLIFNIGWMVSNNGVTQADVDILVDTHRVGSAGDVTTLYSEAPSITITPNGTPVYIYKHTFQTTEPLVAEDSLIHLEITNNNALEFVVLGGEVEYKPDFQQ